MLTFLIEYHIIYGVVKLPSYVLHNDVCGFSLFKVAKNKRVQDKTFLSDSSYGHNLFVVLVGLK